MKKDKLPDKPSELILLAVTDMIRCERSKFYEIWMGTWHTFNHTGGYCLVCFAGGVMAQTLRMPLERDLSPWHTDFDSDDTKKLQALDSFRCGLINQGLTIMGLSYDMTQINDLQATPRIGALRNLSVIYRHNPGKFKRTMRWLARELAKLGL